MRTDILDRLFWFHSAVKKGQTPNKRHLAEHFSITPRQAQRDISLLRDKYSAPLRYEARRHGFIYDDPAFELPMMRVDQREMLAFLLAQNLVPPGDNGAIRRVLDAFAHRICLDPSADLLCAPVEECFSATWQGYAPADEHVFDTVVRALQKTKVLSFQYAAPMSDPAMRRVEPHHLVHYMGSWMLVAWCLHRKGWRTFHLARMSRTACADQTFARRPWAEWQHHVHGSFGVFQGHEREQAVLHFTAFRAAWVRHEVWHKDQEQRDLPDGGLELRFPVADYREVVMHILRYGADVRVIAPEKLHQAVREEVQRLSTAYNVAH